MRAWAASLLAALALGVCAGATAQKKDVPTATFELTGIVTDAKGPLANKIVRVGPVDAQGNMLAIRSLGGAGARGTDPQATTDAQGRFSITVARSFFRNQAQDRIALRVSTDIGGGRMSTAHEVAVVGFDSRKDKVDMGRVFLELLKPR